MEVNADIEQQWARIAGSVHGLAAELCENLRMIIEPNLASRLELVAYAFSRTAYNSDYGKLL